MNMRVQTSKYIMQMVVEKELLTNHFMATLPSLTNKHLPENASC